MTSKETPRTHIAYTLKKAGKPAANRWIELGTARLDDSGRMHLFLDVLPIGGFSGYVFVAPSGEAPPTLEPILRRPASSDEPEDADY